MTRRVIAAVLTLGVSCGLLLSNAVGASDPIFDQIDAIVKVLADISGLTETHPVPYGRMSKRQLRSFLNKRIKKTLKPEEIHADEIALKMFGFVPADFDLRRSTVELLTEQAAAFYDYDARKLFLMDGSAASAETITLAHELSHALADQHFNLANFMDNTPSSDDENLAHSAVVEGEATWLMLAYTLQKAGRPPVPTPEMVASVAESSRSTSDEYPVLKDAPLYIQQSLLFPYGEGTLFFDAVYKKMGKAAFAEVFSHPPTDSGQILHPDRYFRHESAAHPELFAVPMAKDSDEVTEGSLGEFDHSILLRQFAPEVARSRLASHVRGGEFKISRDNKTARLLLQYSSEWDSEEAAAAFLGVYPKILMGKWSRCDITANRPTLLAGSGDPGYFICQRAGRKILTAEGIGDVTEWQKLQLSAETAPTLH